MSDNKPKSLMVQLTSYANHLYQIEDYEDYELIDTAKKKLEAAEKVANESEKYIKMCIGAKGSQDKYYEALKEYKEGE